MAPRGGQHVGGGATWGAARGGGAPRGGQHVVLEFRIVHLSAVLF